MDLQVLCQTSPEIKIGATGGKFQDVLSNRKKDNLTLHSRIQLLDNHSSLFTVVGDYINTMKTDFLFKF